MGYIFTFPGSLVTNKAAKMFLVLDTFTYAGKISLITFLVVFKRLIDSWLSNISEH